MSSFFLKVIFIALASLHFRGLTKEIILSLGPSVYMHTDTHARRYIDSCTNSNSHPLITSKTLIITIVRTYHCHSIAYFPLKGNFMMVVY